MATKQRSRQDVRQVDSSGRLSLGRKKVGEHYDFHEDSEGKITLTPVVVIPRRELWLHQNPEAKRSLLSGLADSAEGRTSDGGDFTKYLSEPDED